MNADVHGVCILHDILLYIAVNIYQYAYRVHQGISVYFKFPLYTLRVYALLDRGKMFQEIMLVQ